jgi:hypothetical protein
MLNMLDNVNFTPVAGVDQHRGLHARAVYQITGATSGRVDPARSPGSTGKTKTVTDKKPGAGVKPRPGFLFVSGRSTHEE